MGSSCIQASSCATVTVPEVPSEENYPLADTRVEIPDAFAQFDAPTATPLAAASDPQLDAPEEEAPAKHSA